MISSQGAAAPFDRLKGRLLAALERSTEELASMATATMSLGERAKWTRQVIGLMETLDGAVLGNSSIDSAPALQTQSHIGRPTEPRPSERRPATRDKPSEGPSARPRTRPKEQARGDGRIVFRSAADYQPLGRPRDMKEIEERLFGPDAIATPRGVITPPKPEPSIHRAASPVDSVHTSTA